MCIATVSEHYTKLCTLMTKNSKCSQTMNVGMVWYPTSYMGEKIYAQDKIYKFIYIISSMNSYTIHYHNNKRIARLFTKH